MNKDRYYIQGMHCRSCEIIIEDNISKVSGVKKVNTSHRNGITDVYYEGHKPPHGQVESAVRSAGYKLGTTPAKVALLSSDPMDYMELIFAAGALFILYAWLRIFGVLDLGFSFSDSPGLLVVLLIGLTAGISSCMALVGGIVLGISTRHAELHPEATPAQKFRPHIFFNVGRIVSYVILGGLIGLIGSSFRFSNSLLGALTITVGIVMFLLGIKLIEIFPRLSGGLTLPKGVSRLFGINRDIKEYSHKSSFITGALTFFLPCGFTQAMQIYAVSTGSFTKGGLIMGMFALGTMPGLLGIGGITSLIKGWFRGYFFKFSGIIVIILGFWNVSNGYNLTGITFANSGSNDARQEELSGKIVNGEQVVEITQLPSGYSPRDVTVKKDIPVKLLVNATNPYVCTSILVIPKFDIWSRLVQGINEITFTPTETGSIKFSCAMGMYSGVINVVN